MKRRSGFTLIEVLIAMVLLAGTLIVLGNAWSGSLTFIRKSRSMTTLSLLLQRKMTEYEIKYKDKPAEVPEAEDGDFGEDFAAYKWKMESRKLEMPDMSAPLTARDGGATDLEIMVVKKIQEITEKAVKEMKVSILWTQGDKTLEYSLTTYIVDYDQVGVGAAAGVPGGGGGGSSGGTTGGTNSGGSG